MAYAAAFVSSPGLAAPQESTESGEQAPGIESTERPVTQLNFDFVLFSEIPNLSFPPIAICPCTLEKAKFGKARVLFQFAHAELSELISVVICCKL